MPRCTLERQIVWVSLPKSPLHPYVILPCTFRQRKWAEVSPESVVLHPRATKMRDSVAQACRAALLGDENVRKCCLIVSYFTLGRRKVWVSLPKSPFILTSFCPTPTGNKNGRECRLNASCRTLGRRRSAEVSLKRAALHSRTTKMRVGVANAVLYHRATNGVGFVAEESPLSLRHSALHPRATKMDGSVA